MFRAPSAYTRGYAKARVYDQARADHYIRHTTIGDPVLEEKGDIRADNFSQLLQISVYDEGGLSYKMPDHVHASKSSPW